MGKLRKTMEKYEAFLRRRANVVGVGIGKKWVGGEETDEKCIVVMVEQKLPETKLRKKDIIPKKLDDVKTDVIETGIIRALGVEGDIRKPLIKIGRFALYKEE
ncbi:MAG: hypothetical protein QMC78_01415 [Methanocellales archaeon]|nr:hypothetical protein [Methanocellales archaeon]